MIPKRITRTLHITSIVLTMFTLIYWVTALRFTLKGIYRNSQSSLLLLYKPWEIMDFDDFRVLYLTIALIVYNIFRIRHDISMLRNTGLRYRHTLIKTALVLLHGTMVIIMSFSLVQLSFIVGLIFLAGIPNRLSNCVFDYVILYNGLLTFIWSYVNVIFRMWFVIKKARE